jgi:DNA-binding MarR family transcriptional regulator
MPDHATASIRDALDRYAVASARHRTAVGRILHLSDNEILGVLYLRRYTTLTPTALGRLLSLTSGGTTALIQRLERDGHLVRERHPGDGRSTLLRLGEATARRIDEVGAPLAEALGACIAELADSDRDAVGRFLDAAAEAAEQQADRAARTAAEQEAIAIPHPVPALSH